MPVAFDTHAGTLATKQDLEALGAELRKDLTQLGNRLSWMIGVNMTLTLLILGKLLLFKA